MKKIFKFFFNIFLFFSATLIVACGGSGGGGSESEGGKGIAVFYNSTFIDTSGTADIGTTAASDNKDAIFSLTNQGNQTVHISAINLTASGVFTIINYPDFELDADESSSFTLRFSPAATGLHSATITIESDDTNTPKYSFIINGTATALQIPEINIRQDTTDIADGGSFDYGSTFTGTPKNILFTIENQGSSDLTLTGNPIVSLSGDSSFSVNTQPSTPVSAGTTATFTISFNPATAGSKTVAVSIANSDSDENPYNFDITGTGVITAAPEINLRYGSANIADSQGLIIGQPVHINASRDFVYTILNPGTADLTLTGNPLVMLSGGDTTSFSVLQQPGMSVISAGSSTSFTIRFNPTTTGYKTVYFTIANNDSDENPYNSNLSCTAIAAPEMNIRQGTTNIADGGSFGFETTNINSERIIIFTIENLGSADLTLSGSPRVSVSGDTSFSVYLQPGTPVSAGSSTTFRLRFSPTTTGSKTATVSITNNDTDESTYNFTISGTAQNAPVLSGPSSSNATDPFALSWTYQWIETPASDDHYILELSYTGEEEDYFVVEETDNGDRTTPYSMEIVMGSLNSGKTAFFRVRARVNGGYSPYSNVISVTLL